MADPLTKLHCCIRSDGGGAVVLTTEERARDLAKKPVWVLGTGEATSHTTMSEWDDFTESPAARSGPLAFERAGVTPDEIDICQIYDAFTSMVLHDVRGARLLQEGRGRAVRRRRQACALGGALPTNTDGGGLSHCHPGHARHVPARRGGPSAARRGARPPGRGRQALLRQRHRRLVLVREHGHSRGGAERSRPSCAASESRAYSSSDRATSTTTPSTPSSAPVRP